MVLAMRSSATLSAVSKPSLRAAARREIKERVRTWAASLPQWLGWFRSKQSTTHQFLRPRHLFCN